MDSDGLKLIAFLFELRFVGLEDFMILPSSGVGQFIDK
jgi:hypothetical protein